MKLNLTQVPGGPLKLAGALDIYAADILREALLQQLQSVLTLDLDLSAVEVCDVVALQLLCSARKSAARGGKPFALVAVSPAVNAASAAVGLDLETLSAKHPA